MGAAGCSTWNVVKQFKQCPICKAIGDGLRGDVMQVLVLNYAKTSLSHPDSETDMVKYPYLKMLR